MRNFIYFVSSAGIYTAPDATVREPWLLRTVGAHIFDVASDFFNFSMDGHEASSVISGATGARKSAIFLAQFPFVSSGFYGTPYLLRISAHTFSCLLIWATVERKSDNFIAYLSNRAGNVLYCWTDIKRVIHIKTFDGLWKGQIIHHTVEDSPSWHIPRQWKTPLFRCGPMFSFPLNDSDGKSKGEPSWFWKDLAFWCGVSASIPPPSKSDTSMQKYNDVGRDQGGSTWPH